MKFRDERRQSRQAHVRMYRLAQRIKTQSQLDLILLDMKNPQDRGVCFELIKPMIKSFDAVYSDRVAGWRPAQS